MNKQMMAAKKAREAKGEFKSFMEVIADNPVIKMAVTQERLAQKISETKNELEEFKDAATGSYQAIGRGGSMMMVYTKANSEAREKAKDLKVTLKDLEEQQENNNERIRESLAWISTEENLKARILKRNNEIKLSLAELQVSYAMQWDPANIAAAKYEQKVKDVLAGGFGGEGVSFMAAMQEMNLKWMEFKQTVADTGKELTISRSEWAKMYKAGELDEYLEKLTKADKGSKTLAEKWAEKMVAAKKATEEMSFELDKISGADGVILAQLEAQTAELKEQIEHQKMINSLKADGVDVDALIANGDIGDVGLMSVVDNRGLDAAEEAKRQQKRLAQQAKFNAKSAKQAKKWLDSEAANNARLAQIRLQRHEEYSAMGADMISASLDMAIGGDKFIEAFGGFLDQWGKALITQGLLAMKFGVLVETIKNAISKPGGGLIAAAAGLALVVVAKKLTKANEASASQGSGGVRKPSSTLTGLDQWFTNGMTLDTIQSMHSSALAPSTLTGIGVGAASGRSDRTSMRVELVSSGRNLVSVIANENSASSRRIGAGGVAGGGVGAGQASLQMGSGWDSGFLAKDRSR